MPALVSVCLPVHNGERFLTQAVQSVLAQTFENLELIIVNDCSSDGSLELAKDLALSDSRIKVYENEKQLGLFANYNKCMNLAKGDYIKPFAQDDILLPKNIETLYSLILQDKGTVLASCAREWISGSGQKLEKKDWSTSACKIFNTAEAVSRDQVLLESFMPFSNFIGEPSAVLFPSSIKGMGFDSSFKHIGDFEYWLRLLLAGNYVCSDQILCSIRKHGERQTYKNYQDLSVATDLIALMQSLAPCLERLGFVQENLLKRTIKDLGRQFKHMLADGEIQMPQIDPLYSTHEERLKNLAFLALSLIVEDNEASPGSREYLTIKVNERKIQRLEDYLQRLLRDPAWIATKPLRDFNLYLNRSKPNNGSYQKRELLCKPGRLLTIRKKKQEHAGDIIKRQEAYLAFMHDRVKNVRMSRSWHLRQFFYGRSNSQSSSLSKSRLLKTIATLPYYNTGVSSNTRVTDELDATRIYSRRFPNSEPRISVIISMERHRLFPCLEALSKQNLPLNQFEVIVCDALENSSLEADLERCLALRQFDLQLDLWRSRKIGGRALAHNQAAKVASAPLIVFLAADFLPLPEFLQKHLEFHQENPDPLVVGVGPGLFSNTLQKSDFRRYLDSSGLAFGVSFLENGSSLSPDFFYTANSSLKKETLELAGYFDEDFPSDAWDDYEMGVRLQKLGTRSSFVDGSLCIHEHEVELEERMQTMLMAGEAACIFDCKYEGEKPWHQDFLWSPAEHRAKARKALELYKLNSDPNEQSNYFEGLIKAHFVEGYLLKLRDLTGLCLR